MQLEHEWIKNELTGTHIVVVVPAYQVARQIGRVINNIPDYVREIIIVDDCSSDDTIAEVQRVGSSRVRLIRHETNQGVGGAMLSGYAMALQLGAEIVVKMDGDDQMDPHYLPSLIFPIINGEADYTKGNRFIHTHALVQMPLARRVGNFGLTFLTKLATGYWHIFDPNNGYTAIHSKVLEIINIKKIHRRYFFETSMLAELRHTQGVVLDVSIPARYGDEVSSLSLPRALIAFPFNLMKALLHRVGWQYFRYDFNAVSVFLIFSLPLLTFGLAWGVLQWYISARHGIIATTGTVLLSVLPIILGVQFLIQAVAADILSVPTKVLHRRFERWNVIPAHQSSWATYFDNKEYVKTNL